jgi:hypothetical protein
MKQAMMHATSGERDPRKLRREIQHDDSAGMRLRRAIVASSLVGMGSMAIVSMFQTGMIRHLPDPPLESFHSDKVNSSSTAYGYGMPDGPITLGMHAANLALAAAGPPRACPRAAMAAAARGGLCRSPGSGRGEVPVPPDAQGRPGVVRLLHHRRAGPLGYVRVDPAGSGEGAGLAPA